MTKRMQHLVLLMVLTLLLAAGASPTGRRPGPPPDPLGGRVSVAPAPACDPEQDSARRPGPPPDPLREDRE